VVPDQYRPPDADEPEEAPGQDPDAGIDSRALDDLLTPAFLADRTSRGPVGSTPLSGRRGPVGSTPLPGRRGVTKTLEHESLRLTELLRDDLVKLPLVSDDMWDAIDELVRLLVVAGDLPKRLAKSAVESVREREAIRPTGWKDGLALPNGRVPGLRKITAALGVSPEGIDFGCRDGLPARIIVLIFLPVAGYSRFAPGIEDVARTFDDELLREAILAARKPIEVVEAVEEAEAWEFG
jgi:PTS system nitrogen regulatory IIA component